MSARGGGPTLAAAWRRGALIRLPVLWRQVGALAWLPESRPVRIAVVTSRRTGRWVLPKGSVEEGMTAPTAAAAEAMEEAGIVGEPEPVPFGTYRTLKVRPPFGWPIEVAVYPVRIDEVLEHWPEAKQRRRRFATLDEARRMLAEPAMIEIVERFLAERMS